MSPAHRRTRAVALVAVLLAATGVSLAAQLVPEPELVDFGQVYEGEPAQASVRFTNQGSEPLPIKRVATTCGCTVATVTGPDGEALPASLADPAAVLVTLQPGESLHVGVQMVTANTTGVIERLLQVFTGDGTLPPVAVTVRAHVSKAFVISPAVLSLGNIPKSGRLTRSVMLQAQLGDEWSIQGIESSVPEHPLPDWVHVTPLSESGAARELELTLDGPRPIGPLFLRVRVLLAHERVPYVEFTLHGVVQADVSFDSGHANPSQRESLDFGQIEPEARVTRTLTIVNHDPATPYKLLDVFVNTKKGEYFETELRTIEEGVRYEVDLRADGRIGDSFFRGNLVLQAEHPDLKSKTISFHGWVKKSG